MAELDALDLANDKLDDAEFFLTLTDDIQGTPRWRERVSLLVDVGRAALVDARKSLEAALAVFDKQRRAMRRAR